MNNFREIHIGSLINQAATESGIEISRICNFLNCTEKQVKEMYEAKSIDSERLLRWSKLLEYDFFRIYSQHLILYAPHSVRQESTKVGYKKTTLPQFRKNIYTKEVIDFILNQIHTGKKTRNQIMTDYGIPKTTLNKWINKYGSSNN